MKIRLLIFLTICINYAFSQETLTIMQYNLTYYGNTASFSDCNSSNNGIDAKNGYLKTIIGDVLPDVFGVNELGYNLQYAKSILDNALNVDGRDYYDKTVLNGFGDICNLLYYNKNKLGLHSEDVIEKDLSGNWLTRYIDIHTLYYKSPNLAQTKDTIYLTFIVTHLKAGSSGSDIAKRDDATNALMSYLNNNPISGYVFFMGDFNVASSSEAAFQNVINYSNSDLNFVDPIDELGVWGSSAFANLHTQSTRQNDSNGSCFVTGGMDDRYDFILMSKNMLESDSKVKYVDGTYKAFGQDGGSYNNDLRISNNSAVSSTVAQALYDMSDHLPVVMDITVESVTGINEIDENLTLEYSNPLGDDIRVLIKDNKPYSLIIYDIAGKIVYNQSIQSDAIINTSNFTQGMYIIELLNDNEVIKYEKMIK